MENISRSYTVKNIKKNSKKFDFSFHQKNIIKEEYESSNQSFSDTQEDLINEEETDTKDYKPVSKFQYYFEAIITIILCFHSYFIYSYLNIIHVIYCFLLTYSRYETDFNFLVKNKKTLMIVLIIVDSIYLILKSIFFIIFSLENTLSESISTIYPFFIIGYEWKNYYEYAMVFIIIILFLVDLIIGDFDYNFWKYSILPKTHQIFIEESINNNNVINFGMFYISLGAALYPSAVNLAILILGFLFFFSLLLKKSIRNVMKKYISIIIIFCVPIYTIIDYLVNSEQIMDKITNTATKIIFVHLFDNNEGEEESDYLIGKVIYTGCFTFIFFIKGFNEVNFYLKCFKYCQNKKNNKDGDNYRKRLVTISKKRNDSFVSSFNEDDNNIIVNNGKEIIYSLKQKIKDEKTKKKLQGIFNENIDCGIIIFSKESSDVGFFAKIKMFLFKFCYTPAFMLHICRFGVILWILNYITYATIILIIWLLFSINFARSIFFFIITKFIVFPLLILIFIASYISNLKGSSFDSQFFGLVYYNSATERFLNMAYKFLVITFFQIFIHLKTKHQKLLKDEEIKQEIDKQKNDLENTIKQDFKGEYVTNPLEMFFKTYFIILDFALIILAYISFTQSINILNQIGLLFLISVFLLNSDNYKSKGIYICLIVSNISFLAKYIVHFIYPKDKNINNISKPELILILLFHDRLYNIHYYWITYYILFLEHISQKSRLFRICNKKTISIHKIIELHLGTHNYIKILLSTIVNFLFGVYIWLLIPGFVFCLLMQDNNFIFFVQFIIIFIIYYKYIKIVNNNFSDFDQISNIFKYTWPLIFSTILNLSLIYFFQFLNKRPISVFYSLFSNKTKTILEVTGLFVFNGDYSRNLLCFFIMFILSLALHAEIGRQIKLNSKSVLIKLTVNKYALSNFLENSNEDLDEETLSQMESNKYERSERFVKHNLTVNDVEKKKEREKFKNKLIKRKIEKQRATQMIYRVYMALYYILHYYWILIFILISAMSIHWMLSISMMIQLSLFCFYVGKSFIVYFKFFKNLNQDQEPNQTIKEKINIYANEKMDRFKTTIETQHEYFKYLWSFTFSFIVISYSCSICLKIIQAFSVGYTNDSYGIKIYKLFSSIMYILGFFSVNDSNNRSFFAYSWGYFAIIGLFSIRAYLSGIFVELKSVYFTKKRTSSENIDRKYGKLNTANYIKIYLKNNDATCKKDDDKITKELKEFNEPIILENEKVKYNLKNKKKETIKRKLSFDNKNLKMFKKEKKEYSNEAKYFYYSKCDIEFDYHEYFKIKNVDSNLTLQRGIKKFLELLIVILIAFDAMLKCNIVSFVLIVILAFLFSYNSLTTQAMFRLSFIILILFLLQYIVFVTNISYYTNPFINEEVANYISESLHIPWYTKIGYRWGTFFSFGTNRYQIISLWIDVSIILILYFYLEFFSFSIYLKETQNKKIDKIMSKFSKKFQELQTMNKNEYNSFVRAMKVSYDIELKSKMKITEKKKKNLNPTYERKLLEILFYFKKDNRYLYLKKSDKAKSFMKIKSFFYLSFHYFLLLLILLISLINQGLIVLGYMSFSIFYLYKSHCFLKGRRWTLLNGIRSFMKPYLFLDILTQFIFQIPLNIFSKNYTTLNNFFKIFGYVKIVDYSSKEEILDKDSLANIFLKILSYFLILIQENIYLCYDFKKFILRYHYEYLQSAFIKGKLYSFLFNNSRVHLMNDRLKQRREINETLNNLLCTITTWNKNLRNYNVGNNVVADLYKAKPQKSNEIKKEEPMTIGKIIRKQWLISLALTIHESSFTLEDEHYNTGGNILKILKGSTVLNSELDDLIDVFEKKNYEKYCDIKNMKLIMEQKRKEENKKKEEKKNKKKNKNDKEKDIDKDDITKSTKDETSKTEKTKKYKLSLVDEKHKMKKRGTVKVKFQSSLRKTLKTMKKIDSGSSSENDDSFQEYLNSNNNISEHESPIKEKKEEKNIIIENDIKNEKDKKSKKSDLEESGGIKLDQPYDDMFFGHMDYKELKEEIRQDFFNNYCSKKKIIFIIIKSIFNFFFDNFEYTVFIFMLLNHLIYGAATSLVFSFLVFIFGVIQYPRPSKLFWKITLIYSTIIIFLKFVFQLNVWNNLEKFQNLINIENNPIGFFAIMGIYKLGSYEFVNFFYYVIFDFLILIVLIMNQFILIRKGLWYMTESDYETITDANDRIIKHNMGKKLNKTGLNVNSTNILASNEIIQLIGKDSPRKKGGFKSIITGFYHKNFSHVRNEKPGKDFYIEYTLFQIIILVYIIFLYTFMEKDQEIYNVNILSLKQFSGHMCIFLFIHIFFIVFDRIIYLKNTRKLKKIEFKVYSKLNGEDVTLKYKNYTYLDALTKLNQKDYEIVSLQYEGCQTGLLMKFANQIITFIFIHLFIFFYLPYYGVVDENETLNTMSNNIIILLFYLLYIFYFIFSAFQIKYGLSDLRKMSGLMKSSNLFHNIFYKIFKNIPFLFELKNFIDWTFTTTALDLWKWLKLEEIISLLYINKCYAKGNMNRRIGTKIPLYMKIFMGASIFFGVLLIVFGPIFLFSSLNPTNEVKPVVGVNLKVVLQIPPIDKDSQQVYELTLLDLYNSQIKVFSSTEEYAEYMKSEDSDVKRYISAFKYQQVQRVRIFGYSETNWDISPKLLEYFLSTNTDETLNISLKYSFTSSSDPSSGGYYGNDVYQEVNRDIFGKIFDLIFNENSVDTEVEINMPEAFSPYQKLQTDSEPTVLIDKKKEATLVLSRQLRGNTSFFNWNIYNSKDKNNANLGIEFITFSDFYSSFTFGMDVITFYVSFVVVVGNVIRSIFLGQSERIMYCEMVNPGKLLSVCEGIKISRIKKDFLQEEKLYYLLIDFMRSPEMFKNITLSSLIFIQENNIANEEIKYNEYEVESEPLYNKKKLNKKGSMLLQK